jgi:BirA family biotin operon repressor/biotin-[acetyl-CoA-carboxylase] ligase
MDPRYQLLRQLADGGFHSGQELAALFGVSRAAIWKQLRRLQQLPGVTLDAVRGRGYRLATPLELLDADHLTRQLEEAGARLHALDVLPEVDSTNAYLLQHPAPVPGAGHACLAEYQHAGRGRRGRRWVSGFGRNLALSLAWTFDLPMAALSGISLAAGVAVADALQQAGVTGHGLKWPNDLYLDGRKLAGILVEAGGEADGPTRVVIGVGVNLSLDGVSATAIDQPWADLRQQLGAAPPRNHLAGLILGQLIGACERYADHGLQPFLEAWRRHDVHLGQQVQLQLGGQTFVGRYAGLAADGGLVLETASGLRTFAGGEVSLRPVAAS